MDPRFKQFARVPENERRNYLKDAKNFVKNHINSNVAQNSSPSSQSQRAPEEKILPLNSVLKKFNVFDFETTDKNCPK